MSVTERMTADDWSFIDAEAKTWTKAQVVKMFNAGDYKISASRTI